MQLLNKKGYIAEYILGAFIFFCFSMTIYNIFFAPRSDASPISAATTFDVEASATQTFAGCSFTTTFGGTDYSQQANPQLSITDLFAAANTQTISSSLSTFTSAMVGNGITIASGTNFLPAAHYQITGFSDSSTVTINTIPTTGAATSGVAYVGGACSNAEAPIEAMVAGNTTFIKSGTYNQKIIIDSTTDGGNGTPITIQGYQTVHGDTPTGSNLPLFSGNNQLANGLTETNLDGWVLRNLAFRSYTGDCIVQNLGSSGSLLFQNINASFCGDDGFSMQRGFAAIGVECEHNVSDCFEVANTNGSIIYKSYCHNNGGSCANNTAGDLTNITANICVNNGNDCFRAGSGNISFAALNTCNNNGGAATDCFSPTVSSNNATNTNNFIDNTETESGNYGINIAGGNDVTNFIDYNQASGNGKGATLFGSYGPHISTTAPSWTNTMNGDYTSTGSLIDSGFDLMTNSWTNTNSADFKWNIGAAQNDATSAVTPGTSSLLLLNVQVK